MIVAIIPARGGSVGIKNKNIINLCGKPLLAWSIEQARACPEIDSVWVTSDSPDILSVASRYGARVIVRPPELATNTATSESALLHAVDHIEQHHGAVTVVVFLQATSPIREPRHIVEALRTFEREGADSLFSAVRVEDSTLWKESSGGALESVTYNYRNRGRRQDREAFLFENGSIYIFRPDLLRRENNRLGGKIVYSLMEQWTAFELDAPDEIPVCEYFLSRVESRRTANVSQRDLRPTVRNARMVPRLFFGHGAVSKARGLVEETCGQGRCVYLIDHYFEHRPPQLDRRVGDELLYVDTSFEPRTEDVDAIAARIGGTRGDPPVALIGIGGGATLDTTKAVSVLLTNGGLAEDYQGWDLPKRPGLYKVGVPTISGSGSEVSRSAVLTGPRKKQGINSDHALFDQIVLDPELLATVPPPQAFYTGMDCYIHCVESLHGTFINEFATAYATKAKDLCRDHFQGRASPGDLMMASLMGGLSVAYSEVGVCHVLSYGLSVSLGLRHGEANCIAFQHLGDYYPDAIPDFLEMAARHRIRLPQGLFRNASDELLDKAVTGAMVMTRALENAFGPEWPTVFPPERARDMFRQM
jgi:3-deoxy-alpha-D-manno-octulosonate 8-oxidase